jgi:GT2 family glycosyltransferase
VHVTAVVVAHDGAPYLPRTLAALAAQTRRPDVVVGADAASADGSGDLLRRAIGDDAVVDTPGPFGAAVAAALTAFSPSRPKDRDETSGEEWIWLLRDDAAPHPRALAELLLAVERAPAVTVAGCKQLDWNDPRRLVDVGLFASRSAERMTLIDEDEQDQGQYDDRSDMFAVNAAGMLVRRDVWDALKGFDPALPVTGDDVDFCWRARLAGHRVVVVPAARMSHATDRPDTEPSTFAARRAEVYTRLKHAPAWAVPLHFVVALLSALWSLAGGIIAKEPGRGASRCAATLAALASLGALAKGRRNAARTRRVARGTVRGVRATRDDIRSHRRAYLESEYAERVIGDGAGADNALSEPTGDSDHDFAALAVSSKGWSGTGAVVVAVLALASSLLALIPLLGAQAVSGGGLLPVSADLGMIWHHATSWWTELGPGTAGHGDPFDAVLWALGILGSGDPNRAVVWSLVLAPALAGIGAWSFAAALTEHRWPRIGAALVWAASPALQEAVAQGRLGSVVAHVFLPWAALGVVRSVGAARVRGTVGIERVPRPGSGGVPSWTAAAAGGLALAVVTAGSPSLLALATVVVVAVSLGLRRRAQSLWVMLVPSAVLFLPVWLSSPENPRAWLADPGAPTGYSAPSPWQLVLGSPVGFAPTSGVGGLGWLPAGVPWALVYAILIGAPVLVAAAVSMIALSSRRGAVARAAGAAAVAAFALGWGVSRIPTAVAGDSLVAPFAGPAVAAGVLSLLAAAVVGADRALERREAGAEGVRARLAVAARVTLVVVLVVAVAGPILGLARWAVAGLAPSAAPGGSFGSPLAVAPSQVRTLPATASDLGLGAQQTKTLVLRSTPQGGFTAALMRGAGTTLDALSGVASASRVTGSLGSETVRTDDDADAAIRRAVAIVSSSSGVDPRADLEALGVGFVVLQQRDGGDSVTASQMDAVPGLVAVGQTDVGWLWRVTPRNQQAGSQFDIAQRASLVDAQGKVLGYVGSGPETVDATVPAGPEGRLLVLAERSDPRWSAWLDGRRLTATAQGWDQAFTLPASGGHLEVRYEQPGALPLAVLAAVVLVITALMAIPSRLRPQTRRRPQRGSGPSGRRRAPTEGGGPEGPGAPQETEDAPAPTETGADPGPGEADAPEHAPAEPTTARTDNDARV